MSTVITHRLATEAAEAKSQTDMLVLATINAPCKRSITALDLAQCLLAESLEGWPSHIVSFFTKANTALILSFAAEHHVSGDCLASAYKTMNTYSGESNPKLENAFVSLAPTP